MDLVEFRAAHPGLYNQAFEAGREADRERIAQLYELGDAVGNQHLARNAISNGHTVSDALPRFRDFASKDDATAAALMKKVEDFGLAPRRAETNREVANRLAAQLGGKPIAAVRDMGDDVADIMFGKTKARVAEGNKEHGADTRSRADIVADLVCNGGISGDGGGPVYSIGQNGTRVRV